MFAWKSSNVPECISSVDASFVKARTMLIYWLKFLQLILGRIFYIFSMREAYIWMANTRKPSQRLNPYTKSDLSNNKACYHRTCYGTACNKAHVSSKKSVLIMLSGLKKAASSLGCHDALYVPSSPKMLVRNSFQVKSVQHL